MSSPVRLTDELNAVLAAARPIAVNRRDALQEVAKALQSRADLVPVTLPCDRCRAASALRLSLLKNPWQHEIRLTSTVTALEIDNEWEIGSVARPLLHRALAKDS